jgi:hypothetical protein
MPKQRTYTDQELIEAVRISYSMAQVLKILGLKIAGGTYLHLKNLCKRLNIDVSHFKGQKWNKGKKYSKIPIEDYLQNKRYIHSHKLRLRLINEGLKKQQCEVCGNSTWNDKLLGLELDHIDGNKANNNLSNLRILCPNCHSQTHTYKIKNRRKK